MENSLCYYNYINGFMKEIVVVTCDSKEWLLFIGLSKFSLKAILLHNENKKSAVPVAHLVSLKELYGNNLRNVQYKEYKWWVLYVEI